MKELLKELSGRMGPSGWEDEVRDFVERQAKRLGLTAETDPLGNLTILKKGNKTPKAPVVLSAYLDEPGMMVKAVTEEGFLQFGLTGNTDPRTILGKAVAVGQREIPGIVGLKPIHLTPPEERKTMPKTEDLYLDLGAPDRAWAEQAADKGDYAVFVPQWRQLGEHEILAKAMGRSVGCSVLLELMRRQLPVDVTFVMTVQRQVGARGAYGAAARLRPGLAVVLDICPGGGKDQPKLGKGPVVPMVDRGAMYDKKVASLLGAGPVQSVAKTEVSGDGGVFQWAGGGARTAALYCPAKYCTAPYPVIDERDLAAMPEVLLTMLQSAAETEI